LGVLRHARPGAEYPFGGSVGLKGITMGAIEETIDATLDESGQLRLSRPPQLPPGPVRVTIHVAAAPGARRGLADVIRAIAAEQRSRDLPGRSAADLQADDDARSDEDTERVRELDAARRAASPGGP
jgi:hypothetical protein